MTLSCKVCEHQGVDISLKQLFVPQLWWSHCRCQDGIVIGNNTTPVSIEDFYYLATVDDTVKDDFGRSFPGNSAFNQSEQSVQCWGDNSVFVHTIDSCPAFQVSFWLVFSLLLAFCPFLALSDPYSPPLSLFPPSPT